MLTQAKYWTLSNRADADALPLANRHYNRQSPDSPQFVPPGRCLVLLTRNRDALWITSWPFAQYVKHAWAGAWVCSCFRNEGQTLSSELIREAVAVTRWKWRNVPSLGMITFVDTEKVRKKRDFGRCYRRAGWQVCGESKGGLLCLQLLPNEMPDPVEPPGIQVELFNI